MTAFIDRSPRAPVSSAMVAEALDAVNGSFSSLDYFSSNRDNAA
jgi:hypothetical protein